MALSFPVNSRIFGKKSLSKNAVNLSRKEVKPAEFLRMSTTCAILLQESLFGLRIKSSARLGRLALKPVSSNEGKGHDIERPYKPYSCAMAESLVRLSYDAST